jgi:DNA polymerase-1
MGSLSFENQHTGILFGFLSQIKTFAKEFKTNKIVFTWDSTESKRKKIFPEYKSKRKKEELDEDEKEVLKNGHAQFTTLRTSVLPAMGFNNIFHLAGYEADDLMASITMYYDRNFLMVTADEDMYQILDLTDMYKPAQKEIYTYELFEKEFGIVPKSWGEVKAIAGCSSDGVPGVPGVGNKTAVKYLLNKLNPKTKTYQKIKSSKKLIKRNRKLVYLPLEGTPNEKLKLKTDELNYHGFIKQCEKYGFNSFIKHPEDWKMIFSGEF